jgi:hypothetical protein
LEKAKVKVKEAVELATSIEPEMEKLLGIQAKILRVYYGQLINEGFTSDQAFELVQNAAPKQLEIKLKKK